VRFEDLADVPRRLSQDKAAVGQTVRHGGRHAVVVEAVGDPDVVFMRVSADDELGQEDVLLVDDAVILCCTADTKLVTDERNIYRPIA